MSSRAQQTLLNKNDRRDKDSQHPAMKGGTKVKKGITINPKKEDLMQEKLDPVGKEDSDINNDGKHNQKDDKYLKYRRKVRSSVIKRRDKLQKEALALAKSRVPDGYAARVDITSIEPIEEVAVTGAALPASVGATAHSKTSKAKENLKKKMLQATAEYDKKKKEARR